MKPSYKPNPEATTKTLLVFRDECGIIMANDVELGRIIGEGYGRHCLSEHRAKIIADDYEKRGFTIVWLI